MDEKANSSEDSFFNVFTQFAEKAYIIAEKTIRSENCKFKFFEIDSTGFTKTYIPIKPIKSPVKTLIFEKVSLKKKSEIMNVKSGIVPMRDEATKLSTYSSLQLIKLNGITFPTKAIIKRSFLLFKKRFLIFLSLQKKKRKIEAIANR